MSLRWRAATAALLAGAAMIATAASGAGGTESATGAARSADLNPTELTWLRAAAPVLAWARAQQLPINVVVQPQDTPGQTPMGMAFIEGRCVLVLSMRGNPAAQATLDRMPADLVGPIVEAVAAHELGHCWRHLQQAWGTLPSGLAELSGFSQVTPEQATLLRDMWRTRREEGFADLVGLAWTLERHPGHYAAVHAWHERERAHQAVDTGPHDTRVWVRLARDRAAFTAGATVFERVLALWQAGLVEGF
jgi:hypothetical protein